MRSVSTLYTLSITFNHESTVIGVNTLSVLSLSVYTDWKTAICDLIGGRGYLNFWWKYSGISDYFPDNSRKVKGKKSQQNLPSALWRHTRANKLVGFCDLECESRPGQKLFTNKYSKNIACNGPPTCHHCESLWWFDAKANWLLSMNLTLDPRWRRNDKQTQIT